MSTLDDKIHTCFDAIRRTGDRGRTEKETCELNGWKVGDVLEGDEGYGAHQITIRYIGQVLVCLWHNTGREIITTLSCREWRKVT